VDIEFFQLLEFIECIIHLESAVGVQPYRYVLSEIPFPDIVEDVAFALEIKTAHLYFDAAEALRNFLVDLFKGEVEIAHPDKSVNGNRFAPHETVVEDNAFAAVAEVEQCRLKSESHGGVPWRYQIE